MWYPFSLMSAAFKGYRYYVEHAFDTSVGRSLSTLEVSSCRLDYVRLLGSVHIVLRWSLYAQPAGLDLYKMYSIRTKGDYVDLLMSAAPVPFENLVSQPFQKRAGDILSLLS